MYISQKVIFSHGQYKYFIFYCQAFIFDCQAFIFYCQALIFHCQGTEMRLKQDKTKCKIFFSSSISFVYNKKKVRILGVNMTFISSNEVKKMFILWVAMLRKKWTFFHFTRWNENHIHSKNLNILCITSIHKSKIRPLYNSRFIIIFIIIIIIYTFIIIRILPKKSSTSFCDFYFSFFC